MQTPSKKTKQNKNASATLAALTSTAMLLPGISMPAQADKAPDNVQLGLHYTKYQEDDTEAKLTSAGSFERYDIDVYQFYLLAPINQAWSTGVDVQVDHMSGASPWFVGQTLDGKPQLIMSGASISDERRDVSVNARHYMEQSNVGVSVGHSDEDDYTAKSAAVDGEYTLDNKQTTLNGGVSFSDDDIYPERPPKHNIPIYIDDGTKKSRSLYFGISQIFDKKSMLRVGVSYNHLSGLLTDPYKAYRRHNILSDTYSYYDIRPDHRNEWALSVGYRYFITPLNAALHVDYRRYHDSWDVESHTLELGWYQNVGYGVQIIPMLRYYSQQEAYFFSNLPVNSQDDYVSSDYRLSTYGAYSAGLTVKYHFRNWAFTVGGERYETDMANGLNRGSEESPALVDFTRLTAGVDYEFD